MYKPLSILLISILICGVFCIDIKENIGLRSGMIDQNLKNLEENSQDTEQSSIAEKTPEQRKNSKANRDIETSFGKDFKLRTLGNLKKSPILMNKHRLLSDDNHSQENHYENEHGMNGSNGGNSSCSTQYCQTCVNSTCTECKLDSNGQLKYLMLNGRCHQMDNETHGNHTENDHKWEDPENQNDQGHVSYAGKKFRCDVGCKNCTNFTECSTCLDGFALNTTSLQCMKCDDKCATCSTDNLYNCLSCYPGWALDGPDYNGSYTCTKCSDVHCGQCSSVNTCTTCKNFYYFSSNSVCQSCLSNCRICNDSSTCTQCFSGYYMVQAADNLTQSCNLCVSGCANCINLTTCLNCYPGYFMNTSTQACDRCSQNCWSCNSSTNCSRCVMGYMLVNSSCVNVIENCAVMSNDSTCGQCFEGYELSDSGKNCTVKAASSTDTYNTTYTCGQNQYVQYHACKNCSVSVDNCEKCNDTSCRKCKPEYFLTSNGLSCTLCSSVIAGCKKCENSIFCQKCTDGYYMQQDKNGSSIISYGNCIPCSSNCQTCHQTSTYCTSCPTSYLLTTARTCVPPNQFNFTLLLNLDLNLFPSKISQFKSDLSSLISDSSLTSSQKENFVQITNVTSGSVVVQGTIAVKSTEVLQGTLGNFNKAVATGAMFSGMEVLSSKTQQHDTPSTPTDSTTSTSSNTGVIIGVVVGVVCAVIIITIIIIYCCCCKKPIQQSQEVNLDEKRSSSTIDHFAASNVNHNTEGNNVNAFAISNPPVVGPEYFG